MSHGSTDDLVDPSATANTNNNILSVRNLTAYSAFVAHINIQYTITHTSKLLTVSTFGQQIFHACRLMFVFCFPDGVVKIPGIGSPGHHPIMPK